MEIVVFSGVRQGSIPSSAPNNLTIYSSGLPKEVPLSSTAEQGVSFSSSKVQLILLSQFLNKLRQALIHAVFLFQLIGVLR